MTLKDLRDYINSLDLEYVNSEIGIVSSCNFIDESGAIETHLQIDSLGHFGLDLNPVKPVLMIYTEEALALIEQED